MHYFMNFCWSCYVSWSSFEMTHFAVTGYVQIKSVKELSGQVCQICGDEIEITVVGEPFVACNECAFPVCRPCYEYERREGNQACPQCKTRYKRIKGLGFLNYFCVSVCLLKFHSSFWVSITIIYVAGSPRVEGDEEEEDTDDLEHEFDYGNLNGLSPEQVSEAMLSSRTNNGRASHSNTYGIPTQGDLDSSPLSSNIPLLTYGEEVIQYVIDMCTWNENQQKWVKQCILFDFLFCFRMPRFRLTNMHLLYHHTWVMEIELIQLHFLIHLYLVSLGHSLLAYPSVDCSIYPVHSWLNASNAVAQPRPMVPKKDIAVYGYGSVAWKDRMEDWKKRQNDKLQVVKHEGGYDGGELEGDELDDPDLPMWATPANFSLYHFCISYTWICVGRCLMWQHGKTKF